MHPIVDEIAHRFVTVYNPRSIYLFGSYAWGDPKSDSDLDFLVIVESSDDSYSRRVLAGIRALKGIVFPVDLLVLTREEFEKRIKDHSSLFHEIHDKGILLYETA